MKMPVAIEIEIVREIPNINKSKNYKNFKH